MVGAISKSNAQRENKRAAGHQFPPQKVVISGGAAIVLAPVEATMIVGSIATLG